MIAEAPSDPDPARRRRVAGGVGGALVIAGLVLAPVVAAATPLDPEPTDPTDPTVETTTSVAPSTDPPPTDPVTTAPPTPPPTVGPTSAPPAVTTTPPPVTTTAGPAPVTTGRRSPSTTASRPTRSPADDAGAEPTEPAPDEPEPAPEPEPGSAATGSDPTRPRLPMQVAPTTVPPAGAAIAVVEGDPASSSKVVPLAVTVGLGLAGLALVLRPSRRGAAPDQDESPVLLAGPAVVPAADPAPPPPHGEGAAGPGPVEPVPPPPEADTPAGEGESRR